MLAIMLYLDEKEKRRDKEISHNRHTMVGVCLGAAADDGSAIYCKAGRGWLTG